MKRWATKDGMVRLYCGDCLDVLPTLEVCSVDAVITDPPYSSGGQYRGDRAAGTVAKYVQSGPAQKRRAEFSGDNRDQRSFLAWCSLWLRECARVSDQGAVLCCFSDWRQVPIITDAVQCGGWTWRNLCTWWKPGCRMQRGRFSSSAEFVVYATNGPHASDGEQSPQNVVSCSTLTAGRKEHIAEKPAKVMEWACSVARPGAVVLDPFMGVATAGVAAVKTGRRFIGIEKEPRYFDLAVERIKAARKSEQRQLAAA